MKLKRYEVPTARDLMTKRVFTINASQKVEEVVKFFNRRKISGAPVLKDQDQQLVGFISEEDLMRELSNESYHYEQTPKTFPLTAESIMSKELFTLSPEAEIYDIVRYFHKHGLRHAPVVNKNKKLEGIVSRRDILRALEKMIEETAEYADHLSAGVPEPRFVRWMATFRGLD